MQIHRFVIKYHQAPLKNFDAWDAGFFYRSKMYLSYFCLSCTFVHIVRLNQMKAERERSRTEMKDLQMQLSEMHDELDLAKKAEGINTDKEVLLEVN